MESDYHQELPADILEKLRHLELEYEDGDITLKGFEKKKASILAELSPHTTTPNSPSQDEAALLDEYGPEPSAADVVDFLDYLPSPTHSPVRSEGAALMEQNHLQLQQPYQQPEIHQLPPEPSFPAEYYPPSSSPQSRASVIPQYRPYGRPVNNPGYYNNTNNNNNSNTIGSPLPTNRPYMVSRNVYPPPGSNMIQPQHTMVQGNMLPPGNHPYMYNQRSSQPIYRPANNTQYQQRPMMYNNTQRPLHPSVSPRPMYAPINRPAPGNYINRPPMHSSQPMYGGRMDREYDKEASIRKIPSNASLNINPARLSVSSSLSDRISLHYKYNNRGKYGNPSMVKSYQNIEPPARPILPHNDFLIEELAGRQMLPSTPRHIPFKIIDQEKQDPTQFETITELLRYRVLGSKTKILPAFTVVDGKGKESVSVTWEKLGARAEKLARVIQEKSGLQQGDCIALLYTKSEVIEFIIALLGCFLAGMVAVTINATDDLSELWFILRTTSTHLILTTENNLKALTKTMKARNLEFPKNLDWWPTNDFGSLYSNQTKSSYQTQVVGTSLAYIEFTKSMNGELKGVAVSHKTIMNTCQSFISASTETIMFTNEEGVSSVIPNWDLQGPDTILTYLEPRQQLGLHASVLSTIFNGNHTIFASSKIMETPAVWIYVMSKYKATIGFATYPGAFYAAKYYQKNAKEVSNYSKKVTPDLSNLRLLFIDTLVVKPDIDEYIAKNLLTPLGKSMMQPPLQVITPIASLPEHGGIILAFRDYLGPSHSEEFEHIYDEENNTSVSAKKNVYALGVSRDRWECILDADALRQKKVVVLATSNTQPIVNTDPAVVRVGSHGFPFANSSIAIVDPNSGLLCPSDTIGEIWINTLSLSDGFWGLSSLNNEIYHVYPYIVPTETLRAEPVNQKFLRTGLLGTMIGGRLVILGSHEECVRQQRLGEELGIEELHFNFDVINTLSKKNHIENCALFDIIINQQHLPVLIVESNEAKEEIISKAEGAAETALLLHGLRLLVVAVAGKGSLPRYLKDGNQFIHHLMTKRRFLLGQLNVRHLKIDVDRTIFNAQITPRSPSIKPEEIWISVNDYYERAVQLQKIAPHVLSQHTGIEVFNNVIDERSNYDLSKFTNIVDILLWRTAYHADEVAFVGVTSNGTKPYSWKKISNAMATVAYQLDKKMRIKEGAKVLICVPFGIDFVRALYACFVLGIIPVIFSPPDPCQSAHRIQEDIELMTHTLSTLKVSYILVNSQSEDILNNKAVHNAIKVNIANSKLLKKLPDLVNIDKAQRYNKLLGPESGYTVRSHWVSNTDKPSLVIIDQLYQADSPAYVALGHDTIMAQCRSQKLTSQIKYQKPLVVSAVGGLEGLGLLNAAFCGVFVGCPTILLPATEFYNTPQLYFELLARNSCINAYADYSLFDRSMSCINPAEQRKIALKFVRNLMVSTNCRTKPYLYDRISRFLSLSGVERESINTVYSHKFNPMVTTRSYMLLEPLSLLASFEWLQQGIVQPLAPGEESYGVLLHDSGIIPINTMIAIVNPETMALCPNNVIGEIWVASDSNSKGLYDGESIVHADFFEACIQGTDTKKKYMRTGDIGFLWNVQRRSLGAQAPVEEGQCLYVLGKYRELLYCDGLMHFPNDIEESIENCHPDILPEGCYVIQIENEIIAIVAMKPGTSSLATIPVIVTCLLERHSLLIDTVVIVNKSELPKKLNGEKRRNKVRLMYQKNKITVNQMHRIKNQHQPILLPQFNNSFASLLMDNNEGTSILSFSQRSQSNYDGEGSNVNRRSIPT